MLKMDRLNFLWCVIVFSTSTNIVLTRSIERRQVEGRVRLTGGRDNSQGRLEIFHAGQWGSVCRSNFDDLAANVVCHDLGLYGGEVMQSWQFGPASGPVWISDVSCRGSETRLTQCKFNAWGNTQCSHDEDVAVRCGGRGTSGSYNSGTSGNRYSGYNSGTSGNSYSGSRYNSGTSGNRYSSSSSSSYTYTNTNTNRGGGGGGSYARPAVPADIGVSGREGSVRLVGGRQPWEGRLEIFHNDDWGTVCEDLFDRLDAEVVCRQLGLGGGTVKNGGWFGVGSGNVWITRTECTGKEDQLIECSYKGWGVNDCRHTQDVGVICEQRTSRY